jgi:hypothetical protein
MPCAKAADSLTITAFYNGRTSSVYERGELGLLLDRLMRG